jgi:hypothetical protein
MRSPEHEILQAVIRNRESPLTKNETEVLVARVLEGVGATGRHACLEDLYVRWQFLRRIGREDAALGLSDAVRDNLVATWAVRLDGEQACFAPGRSSLEPSERIPVPLDALTFVWLDSTDYGLRLMAEFGVPPEIDLELLDSYLADMGRSYGRYEVPGHRARAAAMGLHLHALSEWDQVPPRPLAHFWLDYRLLLAGSALALFCMVVTLRTPKSIVRAKRPASDTTDAA